MTGSQAALSAPRQRRPRDLVKAAWRRLRGGQLSPARLAFSVAVGVFIGCLPTYGLHLLLCLVVCLPFRLDSVVAYLGANISNPFFAPALVTLELEVGALLLTGEHLSGTFEGDALPLVSGLLLQAVVGSVVVGLLLSGVLGALTFVGLSKFGRGANRRAAAVARVAARYGAAGIKERLYVAIKLRTDPVVRDLCALEQPLGDVLDVGCGRGQFSILLEELGLTQSVVGIDWDARKVAVARLAGHGSSRFEAGDAAQVDWPSADAVLLIDVLHYLPREQQRAVLRKAAQALRPGGCLLVRELDRSSRLSSLGRSSEHLATSSGYNQARRLEFLSQRELVAELSELGFTCEVRSHRIAPLFLPNVLLVATRG